MARALQTCIANLRVWSRRQDLRPTSMRVKHDRLSDPYRDDAASRIPAADPNSRDRGPFLLQQIRSYRQPA